MGHPEELAEQINEKEAIAVEESELIPQSMSFNFSTEDEPLHRSAESTVPRKIQIGVATNSEVALLLDADALREFLEDPAIPKQVHDLKGTLRSLEQIGIAQRPAG
jgi:DNA polymerase-1